MATVRKGSITSEDIVSPEVLESLKIPFETIKNGSFDGIKDGSFEKGLMDIVNEILCGNKSHSYLCSVLRSLGLNSENISICNVVVDVIWFYGTQLNFATESARWINLVGVVKEIEKSQLVKIDTLRTNLEFSLLHAAGLCKDDAATMQKKMIRINTGLVYKQQKYNLLREETEGYSKLVVVLNNMPMYPHDCSLYVANVCSIVGQFDLDPNRVLDVVLDVFEQNPLNLSFVRLLEQFKRETIVHMLGFKFTFYHENNEFMAIVEPIDGVTKSSVDSKKNSLISLNASSGTSKIRDLPANNRNNTSSITTSTTPVEDPTVVAIARSKAAPASLYALAATLIMSNMITIQDLSTYLEPSVEVCVAVTKALEEEAMRQVTSFGVINLNAKQAEGNASGGDRDKDKPNGLVRESSFASLSVDVSRDTARNIAPALSIASSRLPLAPALTTLNNRPPPPAAPYPAVAVGAFSTSISLLSSTERREREAAQADLSLGSSDYEQLLTLFHEESQDDSKGRVSSSNDESPLYAEGNQLIGLAVALLRVRGWQQARYILNLLEAAGVTEVMRYSVDLRRAMSELVLFSVDKIYQSVSFQRYNLTGRLGLSGSAGDKQNAKPTRLSQVPLFPQETLAQIDSLTVFPTEVLPLLSYLGHYCCEDVTLYTRLCRLSKAYVLEVQKQDGDATVMDTISTSTPVVDSAAQTALYQPILTLFTSCLLPSLTVCTDSSPFLACQLWATLEVVPFQLRFALYEAWKGVGIGKDGLGHKATSIVYAETKALHSAKSDLKRLAKENTKLIGRKLSKITATNPIVVYNHVLGTIEVFDNLIPYVVDALKYSTDLARDCMAFCLISQLKKENSGKMQKGDTHYSSWFGALTKFIATFYCRYPSTEIKGLLHYLMGVLSAGDSLDLLVLKELLCIMGSCETLLEVSQVQLEALAGGRVLRQETMGTAIMQNSGITANNNRRAMTTLREELISSKTALPLLLFIAQIRAKVLYSGDQETTQLKLISHLFDLTQDVLMQFTDFLVAGAKTVEHIAQLMPSLDVLVSEIGLHIPIAFQLVRPIVRAAMSHHDQSSDSGSSQQQAAMPAYLVQWDPFSNDMIQNITRYTDPLVWSRLSPSLYVLFWSLSVYDIATPAGRYQLEIKRIKDRYAELENRKYTTGGINTITGLPYTSSEVTRLSKQRDADLSKMLGSMTALNEEMSKQNAHVEQIKAIIDAQKGTYFVGTTPEVEEEGAVSEEETVVVVETIEGVVTSEGVAESSMDVVESTPTPTAVCEEMSPETANILAITDTITQHLVYHRVLMSPSDAVFCIQFLLLLHEKQTPFFSLLHCYDRMVKTITPLIFCTTEVEASFIGYALNDMFGQINKWVADKKLYQTEVESLLGATYSIDSLLPADVLATIRSKQRAVAAKSGDGSVPDDSIVTHDLFCELAKVWHSKLTITILSAIAGKEYMYVRCALLLLSKVNGQFPTRAVEGRKLLARVTQLESEEKNREDLQLMAKSLTTMLKRAVWTDEKPVKSTKKTPKTDDAAEGAAKVTTAVPNRRDDPPKGGRDGRDSGRGRDDAPRDSRDSGRDANNRDAAAAGRGGPPYAASASAQNARGDVRATRVGTNPQVSGVDGSWRDNKIQEFSRDGPAGRDGLVNGQRGGEVNKRDDPKGGDRDRRTSNAPAVPPVDSRDARRNEREREAINARETATAVVGNKRKNDTATVPTNDITSSAVKSQKVSSTGSAPESNKDERRANRSQSRDRQSSNARGAPVNNSSNNNTRQQDSAPQDDKPNKSSKRSREEATKEDSRADKDKEKDDSRKAEKSDKTSKHGRDKDSKDKESKEKEKDSKDSKGEKESKGDKDKEKDARESRKDKDGHRDSKDTGRDSKKDSRDSGREDKDGNSKQQQTAQDSSRPASALSRQESRNNIAENPNSTNTRGDSRDRKDKPSDSNGGNNNRSDASRDNNNKGASDFRGATNQFEWNKNGPSEAVTASANTLKTGDKRQQDRNNSNAKGQNQNNDRGSGGGDRNQGKNQQNRGDSRDRGDKSSTTTSSTIDKDKEAPLSKANNESANKESNPALVPSPAVVAPASVAVSETTSSTSEAADKAAARATRFAAKDELPFKSDLATLKADLLKHKLAEEKSKSIPASTITTDKLAKKTVDGPASNDSHAPREREAAAPKQDLKVVSTKPRASTAKSGPSSESASDTPSTPVVVSAPAVVAAPGMEHVELSDIIKEPTSRGSHKRPRPESAKSSEGSTVSADGVSVPVTSSSGKKGNNVPPSAGKSGNPPPPTATPPVWDNAEKSATSSRDSGKKQFGGDRRGSKPPPLPANAGGELVFKHNHNGLNPPLPQTLNPFTNTVAVVAPVLGGPPIPAGPPPVRPQNGGNSNGGGGNHPHQHHSRGRGGNPPIPSSQFVANVDMRPPPPGRGGGYPPTGAHQQQPALMYHNPNLGGQQQGGGNNPGVKRFDNNNKRPRN